MRYQSDIRLLENEFNFFQAENSDDEDSPLRRRKKPKRDPPTKKAKKKTKKELAAEAAAAEKAAKKSKKAGGLSQLLGQRRCATEANERIARCQLAEATTGKFDILKVLLHFGSSFTLTD